MFSLHWEKRGCRYHCYYYEDKFRCMVEDKGNKYYYQLDNSHQPIDFENLHNGRPIVSVTPLPPERLKCPRCYRRPKDVVMLSLIHI